MTDIQTIAEPNHPVRAPFEHSAARAAPASGGIEAVVNHWEPDGSKPSVVIGGADVKNASVNAQPVTIKSARPVAGELDLDVQGFALVEHRSTVVDFYDDEQVEEIYYRGFIFPVLCRKLGAVWSILIVTVWFGGVHAAQLHGDWALLPIVTGMGFIFTVQRYLTGSLLPSIVTHWTYNTFLVFLTVIMLLLD